LRLLGNERKEEISHVELRMLNGEAVNARIQHFRVFAAIELPTA
jgi:hypothetical protein